MGVGDVGVRGGVYGTGQSQCLKMYGIRGSSRLAGPVPWMSKVL